MWWGPAAGTPVCWPTVPGTLYAGGQFWVLLTPLAWPRGRQAPTSNGPAVAPGEGWAEGTQGESGQQGDGDEASSSDFTVTPDAAHFDPWVPSQPNVNGERWPQTAEDKLQRATWVHAQNTGPGHPLCGITKEAGAGPSHKECYSLVCGHKGIASGPYFSECL